jgi:hypothetical protein
MVPINGPYFFQEPPFPLQYGIFGRKGGGSKVVLGFQNFGYDFRVVVAEFLRKFSIRKLLPPEMYTLIATFVSNHFDNLQSQGQDFCQYTSFLLFYVHI